MPNDPYRGLWAELRAQQRAAAPGPDESPLAQAAFERGWITAEQMEAARQEEARLRLAGDPAPLGQILLRRRWLNPEQLAELLRTSGEPSPEPAACAPQRLGRYEILGELGRGGMGLVYRAFDPNLKRAVALKVLEGLGDPERLHREAQAAARLSHPNIVSVYDVGVEGGPPYLAMELLEGKELEEAWKGWPLKRKIEAIEQVARAMAHAHRQGVVHRDLKPGNVMVTPEGEVKVMDLGLARVEGESKLTLTGTVMGTPAYMAPEQVRGERAGPPADVWSLGVMLYEALTECLPFLGREVHEIYVKVLTEEPVRPRKLAPRVPVELEVVCLKAMEKEAARRYASAGELADDLARWLRDEPIRARPSSRIYRLRKRIRRNPWAWAATVAASILLAATAVALAVFARERGVRLSAQARDAITTAEAEVEVWRANRYMLQHDVTPAAGNLNEASVRLRQAIEIQPEAHPARALLGWVELLLGRTREARKALEQAVAEAPETGKYRWWLCRVYLRLSEEERRRAIRAEDFSARESTLAEAARWERRALDELARATEKGRWGEQEAWEQDYAQAYLLYGSGAFEEEHSEAVECFDRAIRQAPSWAEAYAAAAEARAYLGADRLRKGGMQAELEPLFEEALARAEAGAKVNSGSWSVYLSRGQVRVNWGAFRQTRGQDPRELYRAAAEEDYARAIELRPEEAEAWMRRGMALGNLAAFQIQRGDAPSSFILRAEEDFTRAIELDPEDASAWENRARTLTNWGVWQAAHGDDPSESFRRAIERDLARATELDPQSLKACMGRGFARMQWAAHRGNRGGDSTELFRCAVEEDYARAIELEPESAEAWCARAWARVKWAAHRRRRGEELPEGHYRAIEGEFARALRLNPESAKSWAERGDLHLEWGKARQGRGQDPTDQYRAAIEEDYGRAIELNPRESAAWRGRAEAVLNRGIWRWSRGEDATEEFRRVIDEFAAQAVELNPASADAWMTRGHAAGALGESLRRIGHESDASSEFGRADSWLTRAVELDPGLVEAVWRRGFYRLLSGRPREALEDLERAVTMSPSLADLLRPALDAARRQVGSEEQPERDPR